MDCSRPGSSVHGNSPGKNTRSGLPFPPWEDLPNLVIKPRSPALQVDSLLFCLSVIKMILSILKKNKKLSVFSYSLSLLHLNTGRKKAESFLSSQFVGNNTQMWKKESLLMPLSFSRIPHQPFLTFSCSALDHIPIPKSIFGKEDGISHIPLSLTLELRCIGRKVGT